MFYFVFICRFFNVFFNSAALKVNIKFYSGFQIAPKWMSSNNSIKLKSPKKKNPKKSEQRKTSVISHSKLWRQAGTTTLQLLPPIPTPLY